MAEMTNIAFYTPSAGSFLYDKHNQSSDSSHYRSEQKESYQVACHMLRRKFPSQPHPNDLQIDSCCTTPSATWTNWELTERRQYTQAIGMRNARLAHAAAIEGRGNCFLGTTILTMIHFTSLLWTFARCACSWRRRSRLRILSVPRPILLHGIELYDLGASIGLRRTVIVAFPVAAWVSNVPQNGVAIPTLGSD